MICNIVIMHRHSKRIAKMQNCTYLSSMEKKYKYHTIAVSPEAAQQIKIIAAFENKTIREVVEQAIREYQEQKRKGE